MQTPFTDAAGALAFLTAGNARFTLESRKTGARYTYRLKSSDDKQLLYASVLFGPDNTSDYVYLGVVRNNALRLTAASRATETDPRVIALRWALARLATGRVPSDLAVWHDGACGRCGRPLTVPTSIASGIGPECAKRVSGFAATAVAA